MREAWLRPTVLLLLTTVAFCAIGAECRAGALAGAAPAHGPCHGGAPDAPAPGPAESGPCGSLSPLPCCHAPWSLNSASGSDVAPPLLVAIVSLAPAIHAPPAVAAQRPLVLARGRPAPALDTILRL